MVSVISTVSAGGYSKGGGGSSSGGYGRSIGVGGGGGQLILMGGGGGGGFGFGSNSGGNAGQFAGQLIPAAIHTVHNIEFRDVPSTGSFNPATIEVGAQSIPLMILFRSSSSTLNIQQAHDGAQGSTQESSSEDEPHRLVHSVTKPIIQEVHEVITPFRKITQEIQPVQEEIQTIVARNVGHIGGNVGGAQLNAGAGFGFPTGNVGHSSSSGGASLGLGGSIGVLAGPSKGIGSGLKSKSSESYGGGAKLSTGKSSSKSY